MSYTATNQPVRSDAPLTDYELIDIDPHFKRVVGYFRSSDLGIWLGTTMAFPAALQLWERAEPSAGAFKAPGKVPGGALRTATLLGFIGGFYLAYVRSSKRFLGWSENSREVAKDRYEIKSLLNQGKLPYGENESVLDDRMKDIASRNSQYSFTTFAIMPWFNLVNHPYHGVDLKRYYETRQGEENWGFDLKPLDEIREKYATKIE